ncbi:tetratricopeptide repeat protein [Streptacidiphilus cavernicola]|uniref:Tetratricopeptide repeat protein n=1 Tax=Streptacidiphilus cavernicola TaxID=3342716 RepID=A0ABV6VRR2_9ACTN
MTTDHDPTVRVRRARALMDLDRHAQAKALLAEAIAEDPSDADAWCALSRCCHGLDDYSGALDAAEHALTAAPERALGWRMRSLALLGLKRHAEARVSAMESVRLEPWFWYGHLLVAQVEVADTGPAFNGPTAREAARRTLQLAPERAASHYIAGCVAERLDQAAEAEAGYREALRIDPEHLGARNNLARLDMDRGNHRSAAEGFAAVAAADRGTGVGTHNLTVVATQLISKARWVSVAVLLLTDLGIVSTDAGIGPYARIGLLVLLVLGWGAWLLWAARQLPARLRMPLLRTVRGSLAVRFSFLGVAAFTLAALALLLVPPLDRHLNLVVVTAFVLQIGAFQAAQSASRRASRET